MFIWFIFYVDDAFKLTIDKLYKKEKTIRYHMNLEEESSFKVKGYSSTENMWDWITCLTREFRRKKF